MSHPPKAIDTVPTVRSSAWWGKGGFPGNAALPGTRSGWAQEMLYRGLSMLAENSSTSGNVWSARRPLSAIPHFDSPTHLATERLGMADDREDVRLNWRWLVTCCACGVILIVAAFVLQTAWDWTGATIEALIEAGIANAFVGIAFLFERRFVRKLAHAASDAAQASFAEQTRRMELRMDELTDAVRDREQADAQAHEEIISALDHPTYESISRAMDEAASLQALATRQIKVTASTGRDLLSLGFSSAPKGEQPVLQIFVIPEKNAKEHPESSTFILWESGDTAADVGHRISAEIQRKGILDDLSSFDWSEAMANLQKSIDVAVRSRRRDASAWKLKGKLYELLGDDWAVTTKGLEYRQSNYILPSSEFFGMYNTRARATPQQAARKLLAQKPEWCREVDWAWLIERAQADYPS
jgi:hypothetical protein